MSTNGAPNRNEIDGGLIPYWEINEIRAFADLQESLLPYKCSDCVAAFVCIAAIYESEGLFEPATPPDVLRMKVALDTDEVVTLSEHAQLALSSIVKASQNCKGSNDIANICGLDPKVVIDGVDEVGDSDY